MTDPIRVFVGAAANYEDLESQAVLENSIRKYASRPVEIEWMQLSRAIEPNWKELGVPPRSFWYSDGETGWRTERWATPFSGFRWAIPAFCGFEGRAIYCDSDVIFMADIAELWDQEFQPGKAVMAKGGASWRFCVSLWDCAAVEPHILPIEELRSNPEAHRLMTQRFAGADFVQSFDGDWNCLDGGDYQNLSDERIKAIHYTSISSQPSTRHALPRLAGAGLKHWYDGPVVDHWRQDIVDLFDRELAEAITSGYPLERYTALPPFGEYRKASLRNYTTGPKAA